MNPEEGDTDRVTAVEADSVSTRDRRLFWAGFAISVGSLLAQVPSRLQEGINIYDEGLYMTLVTFTSLERLPYRDLWTLYGPGPPLLGALATNLFGDGLLVIRLSHALIFLLLIAAIFIFTSRFVPWWMATAFAVTTSVVAAHPHHFAQATTFVLLGLALMDRALRGEGRSRNRDMAFGAVLLGFAFLGRYEFVLASVALLTLIWAILAWRRDVEPARQLRWGFLGPVLFGFFVFAIVGWEAARLNLVDYPFSGYAECRGMGTPWGAALADLFAPIAHGRWWSGHELMFGAGTYLPPILALFLGWLAFRFRANTRKLIIASVTALLVLFVWLEMRPRAGSLPTAVWPYVVAGLAVCLWMLPYPKVAKTARGILAVIFVGTAWLSLPPGIVSSWTSWPTYDPKYGVANLDETGLYDEEVWSTLVAEVEAHSDPDDPIFVALTRNTGHFANAPVLYWLTGRPPGTRFIEFNPCLTDTERVQSIMTEELAATNLVVLTTFFPQDPPPSGPSHVLDEYLERHFSELRVLSFPPPEPGSFQQGIHLLTRETDH